MRKILIVGCLLIAVVFLFNAWADEKKTVLSAIEGIVDNVKDCDTVVVYEDYNIHLVKKDGAVTHAGLNLFSDDVKNSIGRDMLNRLESELLKMSLAKDIQNVSVELVSGNLANIKKISPNTSHLITHSNSRELSVQWETDNGIVTVSMPLSYLTVKGGSRSDIEKTFIINVKKNVKTRSEVSFDLSSAQPYGDDKYIIPGCSYQNKETTRNIFLTTDSLVNPIWDLKFPLESVANMFICPNDKYRDKIMNITVLKHEYGEQENFTLQLDNFLSYCEEEGCVPFWGVEKFQDGNIEGALFLYNQGLGYDHVLKIDCNPQEVIEGNGVITARASLFVPTNNVNNLFQPYIKKTDKEKIRYE